MKKVFPGWCRRRVAVAALGLLAGMSHGASVLQITEVHHSGGAIAFSWTNAGPGLVYSVQSRDWLDNALWLTVSGQRPWPVTASEWMEQRPDAGSVRFYRVVAVAAAERGKLISVSTPQIMSLSDLNLLYMMGLLPIPPQYDVRLYKVVYETVDPLGGRTQASGALVLPGSKTTAWALVSYQHGTLTQTNTAPSALQLQSEAGIGVAFATSGYAAALPDYLGLGDSPGLHPYQHARSEATASVDMLRAARQVCVREGYALNGQVFLCGYSQGGHATMALHRELESYHTNEFTVTAAAPMAGAYDMSGATTEDVLSGRTMPNPFYFAYILAAYQEVYHFTNTLANLLAAPYNTTLPPLLRGNSSGSQINAAMPADALQILRPELLAAFRNDPNHPLRQALRDNDVYAWTPRSPLRLYHCGGDHDVVVANSLVAHDYFQTHGAPQALFVDPMSTGDHGDCVMPSLLLAKSWFDSLKK
jgi:hypothetical protein